MNENVSQAAVKFAEDYFLGHREEMRGNDVWLGTEKWKQFVLRRVRQHMIYRLTYREDPPPDSEISQGFIYSLNLVTQSSIEIREAFDACTELVEILGEGDQPLPPLLSEWWNAVRTGELCRPRQKTGPSPYKHWGRDLHIAWVIYQLELMGVNPSRHTHNRQNSGCDIVVDALLKILGIELKFETVRGIWNRYSNLKEPLSEP